MTDPDRRWNLLVAAARETSVAGSDSAVVPPPGFAVRVAALWHERCAQRAGGLIGCWRRAALWGTAAALGCLALAQSLPPTRPPLLPVPEILSSFLP